jgi:hypothetical protein
MMAFLGKFYFTLRSKTNVKCCRIFLRYVNVLLLKLFNCQTINKLAAELPWKHFNLEYHYTDNRLILILNWLMKASMSIYF